MSTKTENTANRTTVLGMGTKDGVEILYTLPARDAVIAAYAQDKGDLNTADYAARYGGQVLETSLSYSIGDFWAAKPGRDVARLKIGAVSQIKTRRKYASQ